MKVQSAFLDSFCMILGGKYIIRWTCLYYTGRQDVFVVAMMVYAVANACIGATPAAYAADVMPESVSGFGLGMFRCAGDIGE